MSVIYFPMVNQTTPAPITSNIGCQVEGSIESNKKWIVYGHPYFWSLRWSDCEAAKEVYTFPQSAYDNSRLLGAKQIIGTKTCPSWARLWPEWLCSPPKSEYYTAFAAWIVKIIDEFHPWGIELWNEPDCKPEDAAPENFGCWYNGESWYTSGVKYGQFTAVVYDYVKAMRPDVNILSGALMNVSEAETLSFLSGAKAGGLKGDYLSYHGYITERSGFDRIFWLAVNLRKVVNKPMICTETSVLSWVDSDTLKLLQKDYLQHIYDRLPGTGIEMVFWYTLVGNGWMCSDLQRGDTTTPAWTLYKEMA